MRLLDAVARFRGYPPAVRTDNGPEFTSRAFMAGRKPRHPAHPDRTGAPMQNGYIESFNGKFRDECLNEHWFQTLHQARQRSLTWRRDYNEVRPHSSHWAHAPGTVRRAASPAPAMLRKTNYPTARSINLSTPDFLPLIGTEEGGRSSRQNLHA
jgi:transposase InsO family protein